MKLSYSLLWFDDDQEYFDSLDISPLLDEIKSWGFNPVIDRVSTSADFLIHSPFLEYDLIVVDRNLEGYPDGQDFIADIRTNSIYTEIIFYTSGNTSSLWEAIRERELEGVFISTRNDILIKIEKIGYQSIRKILDLENMRGIVMAEVGDLDHLLEQIIISGFDSLSNGYQEKLLQRFSQKIQQDHDRNGEMITNFTKAPTTNGMLKFCDSNKRWENFNRLCKVHEKIIKPDEINDFVKEILMPRNFLAHGKSRLDDNGDYIFTFNGKEYQFNESIGITLRQQIMKYKNAFQIICDDLNK